MSIIDHPETSSPTEVTQHATPRKSRTAYVIVAIVLGLTVLAILPFAAIMALRASEAASNVLIEEEAPVDPIAYSYFGDMNVGQGSTVNTTVTGEGIASVDDVDILTLPGEGLTATILNGDDGSVRLEIEVGSDFPTGVHAITFQVAGQPEPILWHFTVVPR